MKHLKGNLESFIAQSNQINPDTKKGKQKQARQKAEWEEFLPWLHLSTLQHRENEQEVGVLWNLERTRTWIILSDLPEGML